MMLVYTGAVRSIFLLSREDRKHSPDPAAFLTAANGSPILSYGTRLLSIPILGRRYAWDFAVTDKADFLGHEISPDGVCPLTSKVTAVTRFPVPTSVKAVQEFLGMVNYYRRFILGIAHTMAPLTETLRGQPKSLACGPSQQQAFSLTKATLAEATAFAHQDPTAPLQLTTDASSVAYGAVLEQKNPVADALSRIELNGVQLGINYEDLAREQAADPEAPAYCTAITSLKWRDMPLALGGPNLLCDVSTSQPRPLVPASCRCQVFDVIHGLSHPSSRMTAKLLSEKFIWHGVQKNVRTWSRQCLQCQASKVGRHTESGVGEFPQPGRRFGHDHIDIIWPLPPSGGASYLLMVVDCSTRWPEATPMQEATASACAEALLSGWISRFCVPDHITTELGTALARLLGTAHHTTTAYNPAANCLDERFHRSLKASLMARCTAEDWKYQLPWVLLGLRTTPRANSDPSAAEKTYGESLGVPGELVTEDRHNPSVQRLHHIVGKFAPWPSPHVSVCQALTDSHKYPPGHGLQRPMSKKYYTSVAVFPIPNEVISCQLTISLPEELKPNVLPTATFIFKGISALKDFRSSFSYHSEPVHL
ncbi:uncharacterized protein [Macrobrachium rosenbergii]|uniref:uncharacterized protein n=1 Tax=Macrobrachium rosenbergii TaxID=79674 RepID=UPI0034D481EA